MKRLLLLCVVLLSVTASAALAQGINLSWTKCGALGTENKTFACNTNVGFHTMFVSFVPPAGVTAVNRMDVTIDLQSAGSALPNWWKFKNTYSCRATALSVSADFTTSFDCLDYWRGLAAGGLVAYQAPSGRPGSGANTARMILLFAIPDSSVAPLEEGSEYYGVSLRMTNVKTVFTGSCFGCLDPVCLVLNEVLLSQVAPLPQHRLQTPMQRNWITWQGGLVAGGCPAATPVRNSTWGAVKSLYD